MFFKSSYGDIYYQLKGPGSAPLMACIHGVGMDHMTFNDQVSNLSNRYRVLVWDLPGHGQSGFNGSGHRFSKLAAECLFELLNSIGATKLILLGQSLGSLVAQHFMILYPGRVLASVHVPGIELTSHLGFWAKRTLPAMMGMFHLMPSRSFYKSFGKHRAENKHVQQYLSKTIAIAGKKLSLRITNDMITDMINRSPEITEHPMLITYGEKDLFFIKNLARKWHKKTKISRCVGIPSANHIANQDNPAYFNKLLSEFLDPLFLPQHAEGKVS